MSLAITPIDVLSQMSTVFNAIWPLLAIGLGFMAVPMIVRVLKSSFTR